jgi:hypothetical protein
MLGSADDLLNWLALRVEMPDDAYVMYWTTRVEIYFMMYGNSKTRPAIGRTTFTS